MPRLLTCPQGHHWHAAENGTPQSTTAPEVCPHCGASAAAPVALGGDPETLPPPLDVPADEGATLPPPPATAAIALVRLPGYEILGELGRGGMGVVYKARQTQLDRLVALKMVLAGGHAGPDELARFRTEAQAVARLQHPHIVQIHEVGEHDGLPYFSLEFCAGGSLAGELGSTPLPPRQAAQMVETLARAMQAAHQAGVVHRDLKPANVLLTADGTLKVTDFGLAKKLDQAGQTATGAVMGTPSYMAPEQAGGKTQEVGPSADVYALGAILYEMLTGRPPFKAATAMDTILQVLEQEPIPPSRLQPRLPRDVETICLKCLEKQPVKRYPRAASLAEDLRCFQAGEPIQARPVGAVERAWRWCRRNPVVTGLMALVVAVTLGGLAGIYWKYRDAETQKGRAERDRDTAREATAEAERQSEVARGQREEARRQRNEAERQRDENRFHLYVAKFSLAQHAWENSQVGRVLALLDETKPQANLADLRGFEWYYLRSLCRRDLRTFSGHDQMILSVAFSPDGRHLASASGDGKAKVWDAATGKERLSLDGHQGRILTAVAFSPDGRRLASAGLDGTAKIWDAASGREVVVVRGEAEEDGFTFVTFSPDGQSLATASRGQVRVWDATTGKKAITIKAHRDWICAVAFSPDGKRLVSASKDKTVKVWDLAKAKELLTFNGHTREVNAVAFSRDGGRIASASWDRTVKVWEALSGREVLTVRGHTQEVNAVVFSPDGRRLASASTDRTVRVWDAATGREMNCLKGHDDRLMMVAFSPDGRRLASAGYDRIVKVWDAQAGQEVLSPQGSNLPATSVVFSPDGRRLACASGHDTVKVWDAAIGHEILTFQGANVGANVAYSPDGRRLASGNRGAVKVWDALTGKEALLFRWQIAGEVVNVAFSPDGSRLASRDLTHTRVWDVATGREVLTLKKEHYGSDKSVPAFSPDGHRLATADANGAVTIWDATAGHALSILRGHTAAVLGFAYSPDGTRLASCSGDGTVKIWDVPTGRAIITLKDVSPATAVTFTSDGRRLVSAHTDGTIRLWDATVGLEILTLKGYAGAIMSLAFGPDGKRLASAEFRGSGSVGIAPDGAVRVWDARDLTDDEKEAESLARFLVAQKLPRAEVLAKIRGDATVNDHVKQLAEALITAAVPGPFAR